MTSLILIDVSDEKIDICRFSVRCNKAEIFFLIFLITLFVSFLIMMNKERVNNDV